jgi:hypothetical protein
MGSRAVIAIVLCTLAAGCGGKGPGEHPVGTTTGGAAHELRVYFLRGNALEAVRVHVRDTSAIATAALQKLLGGAPSGLRTALPAGTELESVAVSRGRATVRFSTDRLPHTAQGQIVYTLTQFPTVDSVDGSAFARPLTRADFGDLTTRSPIYVEEPQRDGPVSSPVHASGTADVFEGTFAVDVWSKGRLVRTQTISATSGTGTRGTWSATINVPPGHARLVFYEPSAENGSHLHETTVLVDVRPGEG